MKKIIAVTIFLCIAFQTILFAGQIPAGQSAGSALRTYRDEKREKEREERMIFKDFAPPSLNAEVLQELPGGRRKIYITKIIIQEDKTISDYISKYDLSELTKKYIKKYISFKDIKALTDSITQELSHKEIEVYVPEQSFAGNTMYINLIYNEKN